jgi:hypothetical protein
MLEGELKRKRRPIGPVKSKREVQRDFIARKRLTHSRLDVLILNKTKEDLEFLVELYGKSKAEVIEELIKNARKNCGFNDLK